MDRIRAMDLCCPRAPSLLWFNRRTEIMVMQMKVTKECIIYDHADNLRNNLKPASMTIHLGVRMPCELDSTYTEAGHFAKVYRMIILKDEIKHWVINFIE